MSDTVFVTRSYSSYLTMAARAISDIFSPAGLAIPCVMLGVWSCDEPGAYRYAILYSLIAIPMPLLYVIWLVKSGRVSDFHLPNRQDRYIPFAISIGATLAAVALLIYFGAPSEFMAPVSAALILTAAMFVITLGWQISIHTSTTSGLVTFAALAFGGPALLLLLLVPLVMWARLYLGRHTVAQTLAGAALGSVIFTTMFALRGIVW